MKTLIILLILVFGWAMQLQAQSAGTSCKPEADTCDFYLCKEMNDPCGNRGYWLAYGYKYCRIFITQTQNFPESSKEWMVKTRYCLQKSISLDTRELSCSGDRDAAMDSHVHCYVDSGFCDLSIKERASIIWLLRSAMIMPMTYVEGLEVEYQCRLKGENLNYE